jgi:SAM-dependent methyltransferase
MAKFSVDDIQRLYASEAAKHDVAGTSTIQDMRTRDMEVAAVSSYVRDRQSVLEVGCGNGYVAVRLVKQFDIDLEAFDFSADLVALAKRQDLSEARGRVRFSVDDVLNYGRRDAFDLVFSVRCVQNLVSWEDQQRGLQNIVRALKVGGDYVMEECFWTGLNNLNEARAELGLEPIAESWHNNFFHEDQTIAFMQSIGCECVEQNRFLSGYYFGSRVLLPALVPKGTKVTSASRLNDYFAHLPPAGDFCPMKILRFTRRR